MKISNLLIKNAQIIATMDDDKKEISNKSIYCENGKIIDIGDLENFNYNPGLIIDAHEMVVIPVSYTHLTLPTKA